MVTWGTPILGNLHMVDESGWYWLPQELDGS